MHVEIDHAGGPGAVSVDGLPPDSALELAVHGTGRGRAARIGFRTLAPPPGRELFRFATVNDLHLGDVAFGHLPRLRQRPGREPYPRVCARAALREAAAWGARAVVVKGDLTAASRPTEFEAVADLLANCGMPAVVVFGNHDIRRGGGGGAGQSEGEGEREGERILAAAGVRVDTAPSAHDYPGLRVVTAQSPVEGHGFGWIGGAQREAVATLVGAAPGPAMVAMHHYPQRFPFPTMWPPGIPSPNSHRFLHAVARANPATIVATGHSHRHRRRHSGSLTIAEVGSTKDYPGAWAGYVVHEGGIRQVVRRVGDPDAIAWTEETRRALFGIWGRWSPGLRRHRCFSITWARRPEGPARVATPSP